MSYLPWMLAEKSIVTANNSRLPIVPISTRFAVINFPALSIGKCPKIGVNFVDCFAVDTTSPNKAAIAQIKAFSALHCTSNA